MSKTLMELIFNPVVNFSEVQRAQLAKSTLLTSTWCSWDLFRSLISVQMLTRVWDAETTGNYRTYPSLVKLQPGILSLRWKICLWAERQHWFLSLQWRTCPWVEHSGDRPINNSYIWPIIGIKVVINNNNHKLFSSEPLIDKNCVGYRPKTELQLCFVFMNSRDFRFTSVG